MRSVSGVAGIRYMLTEYVKRCKERCQKHRRDEGRGTRRHWRQQSDSLVTSISLAFTRASDTSSDKRRQTADPSFDSRDSRYEVDGMKLLIYRKKHRGGSAIR
ncbi:hypothetical protein ACMFMF_007670 [Clarireedia jacksonii]